MSASPFVWYELVTRDVDAALSFYGTLLGWTPREADGPNGRYVIVSAQGTDVAGVMALPAGMTQPFWLGYVGVGDADAAVASLETAGATTHRRMDISGVGRIALLDDPQGAGFAIIEPIGAARPQAGFGLGVPGHGNWNELHTGDWESAWTFYAGVFGWTKDMAVPMGPMGTYQTFAADGVQTGAMFTDPQMPKPMWLYYFMVPDLDHAMRGVAAGGGHVLFGPQEVPGDMVVATATDPQGAMFALVAPKAAVG